jgi:hypothetical protein
MNAFIKQLREANEPTKLALEMARAIVQHLDDLDGDEAGDLDNLRQIERAAMRADDLVRMLTKLTGGAK